MRSNSNATLVQWSVWLYPEDVEAGKKLLKLDNRGISRIVRNAFHEFVEKKKTE